MGQINGARVYVLFNSSTEKSQEIVQRIISNPAEGESGPIYKITDAVSSHVGKNSPPASAIKSDGMALQLYFRNASCQELAIKPLKSNPLLKITRPEWEIANAQAANLNPMTKTFESTISAATSTIPKIICLNDQAISQGIVAQKSLPKSAVFSAIVILGLFCSLVAVIRTARNTSK